MHKTLEFRIRERAYEIWDTTGRPDGQAEQHWLIAEREVLAMSMTEYSVPKPIARQKSRRRVTPPTSKPKLRAVAS